MSVKICIPDIKLYAIEQSASPGRFREKQHHYEKHMEHRTLCCCGSYGSSGTCNSLCRIEPVTTEWLGILVGTLALITSVLLGWQL